MTETKAPKKRRFIPEPVLELVNQMHLNLGNKFLCWTVECGLHSGITPCCIMFFIMSWLPMLEDEDLVREMSEDMDGEHEFYIPGADAAVNYRYMLHQYGDQHGRIGYVPGPQIRHPEQV